MEATPKKYRLILIATLSIMSLLFFIGGPDYQSQRSFKAFWNLGHIVYFSLLPILLFSLNTKNTTKPVAQAFIVISITLVIGCVVELLQYGLDRTPDFGDLFRNMIGALIAIFFLLPMRKVIPKPRLLIIKVAIITMVVSQFIPISSALIDEHQARKNFPILSDFQTPLQIHRWAKKAGISVQNTSNSPSNQALRINLTTDQYSGASLKYFPENWKNYQLFQYRFYNPASEPIHLTCRIHDAKHTQGTQYHQDRFNRTDTIRHGWNTITISLKEIQNAPATRHMDLSQIRGVGIFATRLPHPRTIYIDDLMLLK